MIKTGTEKAPSGGTLETWITLIFLSVGHVAKGLLVFEWDHPKWFGYVGVGPKC